MRLSPYLLAPRLSALHRPQRRGVHRKIAGGQAEVRAGASEIFLGRLRPIAACHNWLQSTHSGRPCHFQFLFLERGNQCIHVLLISLRDSFYEILYGMLNIKDQFIVPNQSIDSVGMAKVVEDLKDALGFLNTK